MQYPKEEVRNAIIDSARNEFLEHGYQGASIRKIASEASVQPGNIYNYFDNKDDLFLEILKPVINMIEDFKTFMMEREFSRSIEHHGDLNEHQEVMTLFINIIENNRELLDLLCFNSHGSSLENYLNQFVDWYTDNWYYSLEKSLEVPISKFFVHNLAAIWKTGIEEILRHDIRGDELKQASSDMMTFLYTGFIGLLEWKKSNINLKGVFKNNKTK